MRYEQIMNNPIKAGNLITLELIEKRTNKKANAYAKIFIRKAIAKKEVSKCVIVQDDNIFVIK